MSKMPKLIMTEKNGDAEQRREFEGTYDECMRAWKQWRGEAPPPMMPARTIDSLPEVTLTPPPAPPSKRKR
jgi:hypothetical protein